MELQLFAEMICGEIQERMGNNYCISVTTNVKNNAWEQTGIVFEKDGENICPAIYIDDLFGDYRTGEQAVGEIAGKIIERYEESLETVEEVRDLDLSLEACQKRIIYRLVSRGRNRNMLNTMPYIPFLDMAITFHLVVGMNKKYGQTVRVDQKLQKKWGITVEKLLKLAEENTERLLPLEIYDMDEMVASWGMAGANAGKLAGENTEQLLSLETYDMDEMEASRERTGANARSEPGKTHMTVVTNQAGIYGAAVILYRGMLKKLAEDQGCDFYVVPSSVHEMILIPADDESVYDALSTMIVDINRQFVSLGEVLSDQVYIYVRAEDKFISHPPGK